jgi:hypothetical protein
MDRNTFEAFAGSTLEAGGQGQHFRFNTGLTPGRNHLCMNAITHQRRGVAGDTVKNFHGSRFQVIS